MLNKNLLKALLLASSVFALAACNKSDDQAADQTQDQTQDQSQDQSQDQAQDQQSLGYDQSVYALVQAIKDGASADDATKAQLVADNYAQVLEQVAQLAKDSDQQKAVEDLKAAFVQNKADAGYQAFAQAAAKVVSDVAAAAKDGKKVEGFNIPVADGDNVAYDQFKADLIAAVKTQAATWAGQNQDLADKFNAAFDALTANTAVADAQADDASKEKAFQDQVLLVLSSFSAYVDVPSVEDVRAAAETSLSSFLETYVRPANIPTLLDNAQAPASDDQQQAPASDDQSQQAPASSDDQQQAPADDQQQAPADQQQQPADK